MIAKFIIGLILPFLSIIVSGVCFYNFGKWRGYTNGQSDTLKNIHDLSVKKAREIKDDEEDRLNISDDVLDAGLRKITRDL